MIFLQDTAWGKLNLTLDVLGKREDGYHDLKMVMCSVSLGDKVSLTLGTRAPWRISCSMDSIPLGEENLCWKAARVYFDAAGKDPDGLFIQILKSIPAQAGMAGGSSDAAAVLRLLNRQFRCFDKVRLGELALQVGSDVPYCLFGGVALAEGRGERLRRLPDLPKQLRFVLVKPEFSVSTPALFGRIDETGVTARPDTEAMIEALKKGSARDIGALLQNAFEPLVSEEYPVVQDIRQLLLRRGALGARLTGTGSVVFGLFDNAAAAASAARELQTRYLQVYLVTAV